MSEIKHVGYTWMAKCTQLTPLPFKGLGKSIRWEQVALTTLTQLNNTVQTTTVLQTQQTLL